MVWYRSSNDESNCLVMVVMSDGHWAVLVMILIGLDKSSQVLGDENLNNLLVKNRFIPYHL